MKGKSSTIIVICLFLAGLSLLLYPTVSNFVNTWYHSQLINEYTQQVSQQESGENQKLWEAASDYNSRLPGRVSGQSLSEEMREEYLTLLNASGNGVMGYVEVPAINCSLPIVHGTEASDLLDAVGHLEWSSLPVGGESTHCVVSGHSGLPSAELFTNIDHLDIGDRFVLHVLGEELVYIVDHIAVVDPYDYTLLGIVEGKDYATLVTCTPYGINSHRLLVRGIRVEERLENEFQALPVASEVTPVDAGRIVPVALAVLLVLLFVWLLLGGRGLKGGKYAKK